MINEVAVKAKTDGELLEIWEHQTDYVADVVSRVKAEIERRNLDTSGIQVITLEEVEKEKEATQAKSDRTWARAMALVNGAVALAGVVGFLRDKSDFIALVLALLLTIVSVGVWMRKRWALVSGLILYVLVAVMTIVGTVAQVIIRQNGRAIGELDPSGIGALFVSVFMAAVFNSLRKRVRMTGTNGD